MYDFSKIYQGDIIKIFSEYDDNNNLNNFELIYRFSKIEELFISFLEDKFIYEIKKIPIDFRKDICIGRD